ncbi:hypothetical protein OC845_002191 [Tilletia horrida]|nr:hypothetical protein OC845_002191 [Tilletia horrida]
MSEARLPTILFPRGGDHNEIATTQQAQPRPQPIPRHASTTSASSSSSLVTPAKRPTSEMTKHQDGTPSPAKKAKYHTQTDFLAKNRIPKCLNFPNSLNEAINSAFSEEQYEAGVEIIEHSRANGIIPAEHHLRILFAFALRPTPDAITYRQSAHIPSGGLSAPPSLPLVHRARSLLTELAYLHGAARILRALSPSKIARANRPKGPHAAASTFSKPGITFGAASKLLQSKSGHQAPRKSKGASDEEEDNDGSFLDGESPAAQLQRNPFLVPFPNPESGTQTRNAYSVASPSAPIRDTWDVLRIPPPGSLTEADLYKRALAAADAEDTRDGKLQLVAAQIQSIALRHPARRRGGRGRGGGSVGADTSGYGRSVSNTDLSVVTQDDMLRLTEHALNKYYEIVYGLDVARTDTLRKRAVNGEALSLLVSLWQAERRDVMYGTVEPALPYSSSFDASSSSATLPGPTRKPMYDQEVNAIRALHGTGLAWDFPIDGDLARRLYKQARASIAPTSDFVHGAIKIAPPPPPVPSLHYLPDSAPLPVSRAAPPKTHPYFAQKFAASARSTGFQRGSSALLSSPPTAPSSSYHTMPQAPSSPAQGDSPTLSVMSATPRAVPRAIAAAGAANNMVLRSGPRGCDEVGKALDVLFEVFAGNVLLYDRDGMFRSALALGQSGLQPQAGQKAAGSGQMNSNLANIKAVELAAGSGAPHIAVKWRDMVSAAATTLFEMLHLTRSATPTTAPVLDADAIERGIVQRLHWADVGTDSILMIDQTLHQNLQDELVLKSVSRRDRTLVTGPLDWEGEPALAWMRAMTLHLRSTSSVLLPDRKLKSTKTESGSTSTMASQSSMVSQRSTSSSNTSLGPIIIDDDDDEEAGPMPPQETWTGGVSYLVRSLPSRFGWLEINRLRLAEAQKEIESDPATMRFSDIDLKRERRVWADLEDAETEEEQPSHEVIDVDAWTVEDDDVVPDLTFRRGGSAVSGSGASQGRIRGQFVGASAAVAAAEAATRPDPLIQNPLPSVTERRRQRREQRSKQDHTEEVLFMFENGPAFQPKQTQPRSASNLTTGTGSSAKAGSSSLASSSSKAKSGSSANVARRPEREESPDFEIVSSSSSATPSVKKEPKVPASSSYPRGMTGLKRAGTGSSSSSSSSIQATSSRSAGSNSSGAQAPNAIASTPSVKRTMPDMIQFQARAWVLDWGLDLHKTLNSSRKPLPSILNVSAPIGATIDIHQIRLNALLRVAEVVLGETRRRRKAAVIKFSVLTWARKCVPYQDIVGDETVHGTAGGAATNGVALLDDDGGGLGPVPGSTTSSTPNLSQPASSVAISDALCTLAPPVDNGPASSASSQLSSISTSTSKSKPAAAKSKLSPLGTLLLNKLDHHCDNSTQSAEVSLEHAKRWQTATKGVWDNAVHLGVVPASTVVFASSSSTGPNVKREEGKVGQVKKEPGAVAGKSAGLPKGNVVGVDVAVNWAFTMEMERLLQAIDVEVQGLSGLVLGWKMQALGAGMR